MSTNIQHIVSHAEMVDLHKAPANGIFVAVENTLVDSALANRFQDAGVKTGTLARQQCQHLHDTFSYASSKVVTLSQAMKLTDAAEPSAAKEARTPASSGIYSFGMFAPKHFNTRSANFTDAAKADHDSHMADSFALSK